MEYLSGMKLALLFLILLLLFGSGGFYFGGPAIGTWSLGLFILLCLGAYFLVGFLRKNKSAANLAKTP